MSHDSRVAGSGAPQGADAADRGLLKGSERRCFVGLVVVGLGEQATALEKAEIAPRDGEHEARDVFIGRWGQLDEEDGAGGPTASSSSTRSAG